MAFKASRDYTCSNETCPVNGKVIARGTEYTWSRKGEPKYYHLKCSNPIDRILEETPPEVEVEESKELPTKEHHPKNENFELPEWKEETPPPPVKPSETDYAKVFEGLTSLLMGGIETKLADLHSRITVNTEDIETKVKAAIDKIATPQVEIIIKDKTELPRKIEGIRHKEYAKLLYLLTHGYHVYLYGPSGSGKTKAAELAAMDLALSYGYLSLNPQTPDSRIIGCRYADGQYRGTIYRDAWDQGHLFCFDEIDNASSALMATLNSALGNGMGAFPDGMVQAHEKFRLIVTGNTAGYGANPAFPERRPLDAAIRDRFCFLEWSYDEEMERKIASTSNPDSGKWVTWCHKLRAWSLDNMPKLQVTSRAIYRLSELAVDNFGPLGVKGAVDTTIFKGLDTSSIEQIIGSNPLPEVA